MSDDRKIEEMNKKIFGEYRRPEKTQKRIDEIKGISDVKSALEGIVDLFENYVNYEEKVPIRYDEKTGEAAEFEWRKPRKERLGRFEPKIPLKFNNFQEMKPLSSSRPRTDVGIKDSIVEYLQKQGPVLVNTKFGEYVFKYKTDDDVRDPHATPYCFISVEKVKEL